MVNISEIFGCSRVEREMIVLNFITFGRISDVFYVVFEWLLWTFCVSGAKVFEIKLELKGLKGNYRLGSEP